jgi:HRD ubiquitin ligase complex, ER membrane component
MRKKWYRIVSVLCCLVMLLSWIPERAMASPDITEETKMPSVTLDWTEYFYTFHNSTTGIISESHKYPFSATLMYGATNNVYTMKELPGWGNTFKSDEDGRINIVSFYPIQRTGTTYYALRIDCNGEISYTMPFSVTYESVISELLLVSPPKRKHYARIFTKPGTGEGFDMPYDPDHIGAELQVVITKKDGSKMTKKLKDGEIGKTAIITLDPVPYSYTVGTVDLKYAVMGSDVCTATFRCYFDYFEFEPLDKQMQCTATDVNVRMYPSVIKDGHDSAYILTKLQKGQKVHISGYCKEVGFYRVDFDKYHSAFVIKDYLAEVGAVPTNTPTPKNTPVPTNTPTPKNTPTPTNTPTPMDTPTPTSTPTPMDTPTPTGTPIPTPTPAGFNTPTPGVNTPTPGVNTPTPAEIPTPTPLVPSSTPTAAPEIPTPTTSAEATPTGEPAGEPTPTKKFTWDEDWNDKTEEDEEDEDTPEFEWWMLAIPGGLILLVIVVMIIVLIKRSR